MQQRYDTRKYSVRDFEEWHKRDELVLAAKFQRRDVWSSKARSYLMDTIIRGKPIPKIYMRQDINMKTRRTIREIVDGQQRLRSVLSFLDDGFTISKTHNDEHGGKHFSELDEDTQRDILKYEFVVDLLQDMPDSEVYDVFRRLNTYSVTLNNQELRHAWYFGEFRILAYELAGEFLTFWRAKRIFTDRQILRMGEAEFVSELLIAMLEGIHARGKAVIDGFYNRYDDSLPRRQTLENRFRQTIDTLGAIMTDTLRGSRLREPRLFYPLFCAVYHMQFGLPEMDCDRGPFKVSDHPRLRQALGKVDEIFSKLEEQTERQRRLDAGESEDEVYEGTGFDRETDRSFDPLSREERTFHGAYIEHWVHAENRRIRTRHFCRLMVSALRE